MQIPTDKSALLRALAARQAMAISREGFRTGVAGLDALAPGGQFQSGAVHELLWPPQSVMPTSFALLLAKAAQGKGGAIAWSDPQRELYLPSLCAAGVDLRHLLLLRCDHRADELWALSECLRCRGVSTTVARVERLSQIEARRLQLAAERGGGVGLLLRPFASAASAPYAAATRWLIQPAPASDQLQRWNVQLLHGHGGRIASDLLLEMDRETHDWRANSSPLRAFAPLADRPAAPPPQRATA